MTFGLWVDKVSVIGGGRVHQYSKKITFLNYEFPLPFYMTKAAVNILALRGILLHPKERPNLLPLVMTLAFLSYFSLCPPVFLILSLTSVFIFYCDN